MIRRTACILLAALAFVSCASNSGLDPDQAPRSRYAGEAGESPVGVIPEGTVRDAERGQDVAFSVDYPTRPGPYPAILFSHGFGARRDLYVGLSSHWASQGYVVIRVAHADSGRLQQSNSEQAFRDQTPTDWRNRVRDISAILDGLDRIEESYPELKGKIDRTKIGVAGHSYGAFTAMLIGGARTFPGGTNYADPRVKAIVAMSPQGESTRFGLTAESFQTLRIPTLFMTGSVDNGLDETETPEWRRQAFERSPAGDKFLVVLQGANNTAFTGRMAQSLEGATRIDTPIMNTDPTGRIQPQQERGPARESNAGMRIRGQFQNVKAIVLAFFDAYLRNDSEGRTVLEGVDARGGIELVRK